MAEPFDGEGEFMELRLDKWQLELIEAPVAYRRVIELTNDLAAVDLHIRNVVEEAGEKDPKLAQQVGDNLRSNIVNANATLNQLMLVLATSILEDILLEFFENLFSVRPDLLRSNCFEGSYAQSPAEAAARARLGGPRKFLRRLTRLTHLLQSTPEIGHQIAVNP